MSRYLPDLTDAELKALLGFMRGKVYINEEDVDTFMREHYTKFGLFEGCVCHITQKSLVIKRPIGHKKGN